MKTTTARLFSTALLAKMNQKIRLVYIMALFVSFLLSACVTSQQVSKNIPKVPPKFDFSPKTREKIASAGITIAMVHPFFVSKNAEYMISPFNDMAKSMGNDFEELLSAKGFTMRGPFRSRDEMVYSDKNGIVAEKGLENLEKEHCT